MRLLQSLRLHQKFLTITGIAFLLPLLFYAVFLGLCLVSIGEIEKKTLSDEILEMESLVRRRMAGLERVAKFVRAEINVDQKVIDGPSLATQYPTLQRWMREVSRLDFVVLQVGDQVIPLFIREKQTGQEILTNRLTEAFHDLSKSNLGSGLIQIQGKIYLVHLSPPPDPSSGFTLFAGLNMEEDLLAPVSQAAQGHFEVTEISKNEIPSRQAASWITVERKGISTIHHSLPGAIQGTYFDLRFSSQEGLFSQLRTRLVWFPAFFLGAILISGLVGTTWATTLVLRPLSRMTKTMASVAGPEDYATRVPEDTQDETGDLAASFNRLMARLEEAQSDLETAQRTRLETEKLATLHATVITLAHQINNPLAALVGQAELLLLDPKTPAKMKKSLEVIRDMGLRIAEVMKQLQVADTIQTTSYLRTQDMVRIELHDVDKQKEEVPA
jgi:HAMP domain-containing protein